MATRARARVILSGAIDILNKDAAEVFPPPKQVFRAVSAILALVRDRMIDNKDCVQLCSYLCNVCLALKTATQGKDADDLSESERMGLKDLERFICGIERTLRRGTSTPCTGYNKEEVDGYELGIQQILDTFNAPNSPLGENPSAGEHPPHLAPVDTTTATTSVPESACGRLIRRAFTQHELPSLIDIIALDKDEGNIIFSLPEDDAQTFIDVIDEALDAPNLSLFNQEKCLKLLYRTCRHHALLPRALKIPICYDRTSDALYRGGFSDVWKGEYCGRDVAVKVIRTYSSSDLEKIIGRFCKEVVTWKFLRHPNVLPLIGVTMSETRFAMISDWIVNGNINDFVKAYPDINRPGLLVGVTKGLIYIHGQGMIHGDLKGANILIDQAGHARLADFGLLTIISNPVNLLSSSSCMQGGTARWMGPELIAPERFGFEKSRPTKASDCYALGMVIYETISGKLPFHEHTDLTVFLKVVEGERPPRAVGFTDDLWGTLKLCWAPQPYTRPNIEDVLQCLERVLNSSEPPSPGTDQEAEDGDDWDSTSDSSGFPNGRSDTRMTGRSTTASSDATGGTDVGSLGEATYPGVLISQTDSNHGSTDQDLHTTPETTGNVQKPGFDTRTPVSRPPSRALQRSPQPLEDVTVPTSDRSIANGTQVQPRSFGTRNFTVHPVQGMVALTESDGTVQRVYGPPLDLTDSNGPEFRLLLGDDSRVTVPQLRYAHDDGRENWDRKPPVFFSTWGRLGVKLSDVAYGAFAGIDDGGEFPFGENSRGVTIRIYFPGYPSSIDVEKVLNPLAVRRMMPAVWPIECFIRDYNMILRGPMTISKLVQMISRIILSHIANLEAKPDLFPFDDRVGEQWRLGQGLMKFEHMMIIKLENVSSGSWSPTICIEYPRSRNIYV